MKNARFWTWGAKGLVKITLKPGQELHHHGGGPTDEGYSYTGVSLAYDTEHQCIVQEVATHSCDCDGPLDTYTAYRAELDQLKAHESRTDHGVLFPVWERVTSRQRDYYAEQMGY